jgi:3-hydroxyacyl-CoA dehydrogenase
MWPKTPTIWYPTTRPGQISSCRSSWNQDDRKATAGQKDQGRFYKTDLTPEWKKIRKVIDPKPWNTPNTTRWNCPAWPPPRLPRSLAEKMEAVVYGDDKGARFAWKAVAANLIYAANRIPEISDTIVEIDNAMKWGYNFEMGPFETWDAIGVKESVAKMEADGFAVPGSKVKGHAGGRQRTLLQAGKRQTLFYDFADQAAIPAVKISENIISLAGLKGGQQDRQDLQVRIPGGHRRRGFCLRIPHQDERHQR